MTRRRSIAIRVPRPDRIRRLEGAPFGWLDVGLLRQGWLRALSPEGVAVYAFLCLAANRQGVSFYRRDRIGSELGLSDQILYHALSRLRELDLVAYAPFRVGAADGFHQVLALPPGPAPAGLPALVEALADRLGRQASSHGHPRSIS
jgi:hypothetical protein